jgi:hypothetical protein
MDCSVTATRRHLDVAEAALGRVMADAVRPAADGLLLYSLSLDVPAFHRARVRRRRRLRRLAWVIALAVAAAGLLLAIVWLREAWPAIAPPPTAGQ